MPETTDEGPETSTSGPVDGGSDSPQADTDPPVFHYLGFAPLYPGPTSKTEVSCLVTDDSSMNITLRYGYNNKTWSNTTTSLKGYAPLTYNDRNPTSGTTSGNPTKTYTLGDELMHLVVNIHSSDHDTMRLRVRGQKKGSTTWEVAYDTSGLRDGIRFNADMTSRKWVKFEIYLDDTENNDQIYYNITYKVKTPTYTGILPAAGSNNWVYAYFNATDASNNSADSNVVKWFIDRKKPAVKDVSTINLTRARSPYYIYANVTDNNMIGYAYINWSLDNSTFYTSVGERVSGTDLAAQWRMPIPVPPKNVTVYYLVGVYDAGDNHANTSIVNLTWNPPPRISGIDYTPYYINNRTSVKVNATVTDADGVSHVWVRYSAAGIPWTRVNATKVGSTDNWTATIPPVKGSNYVHFRFYANDTEGGENYTSSTSYPIDEYVPSYLGHFRPLPIVGPKDLVDVICYFKDDNPIVDTKVQYGTDGTNWTNLTTSPMTGQQDFSDRNPTSGTTNGNLQKTYELTGELQHLTVYIHSSDHDTMRLRVRGQKAGSSTWESFYDRSGLRDGTYVNDDLSSREWVLFEIYLDDTENNDGIYYTCQYTVDTTGPGASIPAAGTTPRVYYRFYATDAANNTAYSPTYYYDVDSTGPTVVDNSVRTGVWRGIRDYPVYANITDAVYLREAYLNWSTDGTTWTRVLMTKLSGSTTSGQFRAYLPYPMNPTKNLTYRVYIDAYDYPRNLGRTSLMTFYWNPPPWIRSVSYLPLHPNNRTEVDITADIWDDDTVSKMYIMYSPYGDSNWYRVNGTLKSGTIWNATVPKVSGTAWVQYVVYGIDADTGENHTATLQYHVDERLARVHTPYTEPYYPNASIPIWVEANITDFVGINNASMDYRFGTSGPYTYLEVKQASHRDSLTVAGHMRQTDTAWFNALADVGARLGTWNASLSGMGGTPNPNMWTDVDCIMLDGAGSSYMAPEGYAAAMAGKFVVTDRYTFLAIRSLAGNPSYTYRSIGGFTTYGLTLGRGAVVYTNLYNYYYLGYSYDRYNDATRDNVVENLRGSHRDFVPFGALVPKTTTAQTVFFRYHVTDLSNLSFTTDFYNYTTDGADPAVTSAAGPPSPPLQWRNETHAVWVSITDDTFIGGADVVYSFDNGSSWSTRALSRTSGNDLAATWSGTIPAPYVNCWVWYHYVVKDRAGNAIRYPASSEYEYRATDMPKMEGLHTTPMKVAASGQVTLDAYVSDLDGIASVALDWWPAGSAATTVSMIHVAGNQWRTVVTAPASSTRMYWHVKAVDTLGMSTNSTDRFFIVDADVPYVYSSTTTTPTYPNATDPATISAFGTDNLTAMQVHIDYKYGISGTVNSVDMGMGGQIETVVRNPTAGVTTATLSGSYYAPSGSVIGRVTLRVWSEDHANNYVRLRGRTSSGSWVNIYYSSSTTDGIKYDGSVEGTGYTAIDVYVYDRDSPDHNYYNVTYTTVSKSYATTVPAPGYSVWVYHRIRATDEVGNTANGTWVRYWADGTEPRLLAHKRIAIRPATDDITLQATFMDESWMDRAQLWYSYGTSIYSRVNMTNQYFNGTHLGASGVVPASSIPLTVRYYFVSFDAAGNRNVSRSYTYTTKMTDMTEGVFETFDSSVLDTPAGFVKWEWDFDYNGTFNADRTTQVTRFRYYDNGTYVVALRLTDAGGNVTFMTFSVVVLDKGPMANIDPVDPVTEGTQVLLDGTYSASWPDALVSWEWDIDYDGTTFDTDLTGSAVNHTYLEDGTYTVALRVTDDDGSTHMTTTTITVRDGKPDLAVSYPTNVDEGVEFTLDANGTVSWPDALDRIEWDLDYDGTFSVDATGMKVNHTYMDNKDYRFAVRAYDDDGSVTELVATIQVGDLAPTANITAVNQVDEGSPITFNGNLSTSHPDALVSYEWDFHYEAGGFTQEATGDLVNFTYMDNGTYTIALRVWDDDGSSDLVTVDVLVVDLAPHPGMVSPLVVDEGEPFNVTDNSTSYPDEIVSYDWDFDYHGEDFVRAATGTWIEYTYMDHGKYTIALRVTDDDGSMVITTFEIEVGDLGPTAVGIVTGDFVEGSSLLIDGRSSLSYPDEIVTYEWDLDYDGETFTADSELDLVEHAYMDDGTYTVALRVTDDDGSVHMWTRTLEITDAGPTAVITLEDRIHPEGALVIFSAGSSTSYPDVIVAYHWDWDGDGTVDDTMTEENGRHMFTTPGRYEVTLTVEDDDGSTHSVSVSVTIEDIAPTAKLEVVHSPEGEVVLLNASASEEPGSDFVAFRWDLNGDGAWDVEETCATLEWVWTEPGDYSITVQVEDEDGSIAKRTTTLKIYNVEPQVDAGGPYTVDEGVALTLVGGGTYEPGRDFTAFLWDMDGDGRWDVESRISDEGGISTDAEWTFDVAGTYEVRLYVEDVDGTSGEATVTVEVVDLDPQFDVVLPTDPAENVPATFTLENLFDPGTEEFIVTWRFGDGSTAAEGVTVEHVFPEQGTYSGSVTVEDNDGNAYTVPWPTTLDVANSAPVVEVSLPLTELKAIEDSKFTLSVLGVDTANDSVTYEFEGPGGSIDPDTGLFEWTPLDDHVGSNKFTFIAIDEDGGRGTLEVEIDVEDVDNDFLGMSTAAGLGLIALMVLVLLVAALVVARQRGMIGAKEDGEDEDVIEPEAKVDLKETVEVDLSETTPEAGKPEEEAPTEAPPPAVPAPVKPAKEGAPPPTAPPKKKRPPEGRPPRKNRPPGAGPPRRRRPPGEGPPRKKRPPGSRPPPRERPPGEGPPRKKRPPGSRPPPRKRPPGEGPPRKRKRPPGSRPPPRKRPPGEGPPRKRKRPPQA